MPFIASADAYKFDLPDASFSGLAAPSRGATENAVWIVTLHPAAPGVPHRLTREETFIGIEGRAIAKLDGQVYELTAGSALVVPAHTEFQLSNPGPAAFRAVAVMPVGGQAMFQDGEPFTPPWVA
jgi:mannose-6-phosphate isomerase-like protein (cupin superfamily)